MRRTPALALAFLLGTSGTVHASTNDVGLHLILDNEQIGDGTLAAGICWARAIPDPGWVPVAVTVRCTFNGFSSPSVTAPGAVTATFNANATTSPVEVCIYGTAIFSPTVGELETVSRSVCFPT